MGVPREEEVVGLSSRHTPFYFGWLQCLLERKWTQIWLAAVLSLGRE